MSESKRKSRVNERNLKRRMKEFSYHALEIASIAQEVVKRRMERALYCEGELDSFMKSLLKCAEVAEDKAAAKSILSRFEAIKIEDLSKVMSVLKACYDPNVLNGKEEGDGDTEDGRLKFEDVYG